MKILINVVNARNVGGGLQVVHNHFPLRLPPDCGREAKPSMPQKWNDNTECCG